MRFTTSGLSVPSAQSATEIASSSAPALPAPMRRSRLATEDLADPALAPLAGDVLLRAERMAAEAVAHHHDGARPALALVARGEELHHRLGDDRHRRFHAQSIGHQPAHFAGVL